MPVGSGPPIGAGPPVPVPVAQPVPVAHPVVVTAPTETVVLEVAQPVKTADDAARAANAHGRGMAVSLTGLAALAVGRATGALLGVQPQQAPQQQQPTDLEAGLAAAAALMRRKPPTRQRQQKKSDEELLCGLCACLIQCCCEDIFRALASCCAVLFVIPLTTLLKGVVSIPICAVAYLVPSAYDLAIRFPFNVLHLYGSILVSPRLDCTAKPVALVAMAPPTALYLPLSLLFQVLKTLWMAFALAFSVSFVQDGAKGSCFGLADVAAGAAAHAKADAERRKGWRRLIKELREPGPDVLKLHAGYVLISFVVGVVGLAVDTAALCALAALKLPLVIFSMYASSWRSFFSSDSAALFLPLWLVLQALIPVAAALGLVGAVLVNLHVGAYALAVSLEHGPARGLTYVFRVIYQLDRATNQWLGIGGSLFCCCDAEADSELVGCAKWVFT